jgi:hypothetical protein
VKTGGEKPTTPGLPSRRRSAVGVALACCAFALVLVASGTPAAPPFRTLLIRHVARDTTTAPGFQHATVVEPSIAAGRGGELVTVFQSGRSMHRGAAATGFATSRDGGKRWEQGVFQPILQAGTPPAAPVAVNDAIVSYDWVHGTWLVTSTAEFGNGSRTLQVHRSNDGVHWSTPGEVARGMIDHPWLACDRGAASSFRGRCYVAFARQDQQRLGVRWTTDGGATWSAETAIPSALGQPTAAFPVVRPDGRLVIVFRQGGGQQVSGARPPFTYSAVASVDGGRTFASPTRIAIVRPYFHPHFRGFPALVPSVAVGARGRVYAAWHSCRYRPGCRGNDIVISQSTTGARWTRPKRVPLDGRDHVIPGLAIAPASSGHPARLGLAYYTISSDRCRSSGCRITPYFISSSNGGRTWSGSIRLHAPMRFTWLPQSPSGQSFVADNISTAFVNTTAWSAVTVAGAPTGNRLHVTVAVARIPR